MRKGQAELIVVLGVMLVIVLVAYYAIRGGEIVPSPVPKGIYEEQKDVSATVSSMVRRSADLALRDMMAHGGFLEEGVPEAQSADFMLTKVPYWVRCDQEMAPELEGPGSIEASMEGFIEDSVRDGLDDVRMLYGEDVAFDPSSIDAKVDILGDDAFEPDSIEITLDMKTTVRDYAMAGDLYPYKVRVDSKFGKIWAFGRDFAEASAANRYFEKFTIAAIYFSEEAEDDEGFVKLPTMGVLTDCGDVLSRNPEQINQYLLEIAEYVMATVGWWRPMANSCSESSCMANSLDMAIQYGDLGLASDSYRDLAPETKLTDYWVFDIYDFMMATNFKMPRSGPFVIPICTASYNHAYNFSYPFVVRVRDPYTGYWFSFGAEAAVRENDDGVMAPGPCGSAWAVQAECGEEKLLCQGGVTVNDDEGGPIEGAWVVFGGCPVGSRTGSDGRAEGKIKCGPGDLYAYKSGNYEFFQRESVSATSLGGPYSVTLNPVNPVRFHFKQVEMTVEGKKFLDGSGDAYEDAECGACSTHCNLDTVTSSSCLVSYADDHVYAYFDSGTGSLPVNNIDMSSVPKGCEKSDDCAYCAEHSKEVDTADETQRTAILDACGKCRAACHAGVFGVTTVDYMPSGHTYSVNATMYDDSSSNYAISGLFENAAFTLEKEYTGLGTGKGVYMYVPRRAGDMNTLYDIVITDTEKNCLKSFMANKCGINPVEPVEHVSQTIVFEGSQCSCENLEPYVSHCGGVVSGFYDCAPGGGSCGVFEGECMRCCDLNYARTFLESSSESCGVKVICR